MLMDSTYLTILPKLAIVPVIYTFNVVTIALRDAFDVKPQNTRI